MRWNTLEGDEVSEPKNKARLITRFFSPNLKFLLETLSLLGTPVLTFPQSCKNLRGPQVEAAFSLKAIAALIQSFLNNKDHWLLFFSPYPLRGTTSFGVPSRGSRY